MHICYYYFHYFCILTMGNAGDMAEKKRLEDIDFVKFVAIVFVVWGHVLQYGVRYTPHYDGFFHDPMFGFIYSFHIPLFMVLSGFFAASCLKRNFFVLLKNKVMQLFVPCVMWTVLYRVILLLVLLAVGFFPWFGEWMPDGDTLHQYWFINSVFFCYLCFYVSMKLMRKAWIACVVTCVLAAIIPGGSTDNLNFMLPFFWTGYFMNCYREKIEKDIRRVCFVSFLVFAWALVHWSGDYTVYRYPIEFFKHGQWCLPDIGLMNFRFIIGLAGSVFFITGGKLLFIRFADCRLMHHLATVGRYTLSIYILDMIFVSATRDEFLFTSLKGNVWLFDLGTALVLTAAQMVLFLLLIKLADLTTVTRKIFLGQK
jgi:fucose 4-O-acetylase-like acetyltransferase